MIDIKQEYFFPIMFRLFGGILILSGLLVFMTKPHSVVNYLIILLLIIVGVVMILLRYGLTIDSENKTYRIYTTVFGLRFGKDHAFNYIEKYYINAVDISTMMTTRSGLTHDIKKSVFKAYMKLDNGEKIHVDTDRSKDRLEVRVLNYIKASESALQQKTL